MIVVLGMATSFAQQGDPTVNPPSNCYGYQEIDLGGGQSVCIEYCPVYNLLGGYIGHQQVIVPCYDPIEGLEGGGGSMGEEPE